MKRKKALAGFLSFILGCIFLGAQTAPEAFLGHAVGADRKLADYDQIQGYFQKIAGESRKIKLFTIGQSTLKKPVIMAAISSAENIARLDDYRAIAKKLRDARGLSPADARKLARDGKAMVLITCGIHATEIGSVQGSLELAYLLITGKTPFDAEKVLNDVIVLLVPSFNPDGEQMVTEWYRKYLGTKYEGGPMPWLYHHYAGHDDNRDYVAFNLAESKALARVVYHDWLPQIHFDQHQMNTDGARAFIPPFPDPVDLNFHPLLVRGVDLLGTSAMFDLQKEGFKGIVSGSLTTFQDWWKGTSDCTSRIHNVVGLFSELASAKVATPIYIDPSEINEPYVEKSRQFPDPWPGGWWRLRDIVDYDSAFCLSLIKTASLHKEDFLYNFYRVCKDAIEAGETKAPYAFVVPQEQADYPTTLRMLEILSLGGAEIHQAREPFVADGLTYTPGSFVFLMSQPYRPYVASLLEARKYPDMSRFLGGTMATLGDNAAWSLPLQMGVSAVRIEKPFAAKLEKIDRIPHPEAPAVPSTPYIVLDSSANASFSVAASLLGANAGVYRSKDAIDTGGLRAAAGSFLVENSPQVQKALPSLLAKWHLRVSGLEDIARISKAAVKSRRVGLYQSWRGNMDEGWTRYVLDDFEIPYATLHNEDFRAVAGKPVDLKAKWDVLIFADESPDVIKTGRRSASGAYGPSAEAYPPEYEGGIEEEGVAALRAFVGQGGILVTLNAASRVALREFRMPARDVLEGVSAEKFSCPKSLLKIRVDNRSPIGYGMPAEAAGMFTRGLAFETSSPPTTDWEQKVVATYAPDDLLLTGWISGEELIARRAAVVDARYQKGRIILIGFLCQHRAQTHGTFKVLLNALFYPELD